MNLGRIAYLLSVFYDRLVPASNDDATVHLPNEPGEPPHDSDELPEHFEHPRYLLGLPTPSASIITKYTDLCI